MARETNMRIFVHLDCLTDGSPWDTQGMFGTVPTAADYWTIVDAADRLDSYWIAITDSSNFESKRRFHAQYCLNHNPLAVSDDWCDIVSDSLLITRNLNLARQWCGCGGSGARWINEGVLHDASGSTDEWLCRIALEATCN